MGAYTCEYGVVHKTCRCPKPHTIRCDVPREHEVHGGKHKAEPEPKYKSRVVLRGGQVADLAWLMRHVLDSGVTDGKRLAALQLLEMTKE